MVPPPTSQPWKLTRDQVEKLRRELPEPIRTDERGAGRKTHGRWIGMDGTARKIVSGQDRLSRAAEQILTGLGFGSLFIADHAEIELATYLRQRHEATGTPQSRSNCGTPASRPVATSPVRTTSWMRPWTGSRHCRDRSGRH
jgi:hypothetical protein